MKKCLPRRVDHRRFNHGLNQTATPATQKNRRTEGAAGSNVEQELTQWSEANRRPYQGRRFNLYNHLADMRRSRIRAAR